MIIDPVKEFTQFEEESIKNFLEDGGKILIMLNETDGPGRSLINDFQMDIENTEGDKRAHNITIKTLPIEPWGLSIVGGEPLKPIGNRTILSRSSYGKGEVIVFVPSYIFRDGIEGNPGYMGSVTIIPQEVDLPYDIEELYDLEFYIFEEVIFNDTSQVSDYGLIDRNQSWKRNAYNLEGDLSSGMKGGII